MISAVRTSPLLRYALLRILQVIPVMWGVSFLCFGLLNLLPGDAAASLLGVGATKAEIAKLSGRLGLDEPFFVRYGHWLWGLLQGHLGSSIVTHQTVSSILGQRLPVSFELILFAFVISLVTAIPVALLAVRRPKGVVDRMSIVTSMFGLSCPNFVFALLLVLVFAVHLRLFPSIGFVSIGTNFWQNIHDLILPAGTIGFGLFCSYSRLLRADISEQYLSEDYIVTARSKGLTPRRILIRHAFRNSLFGLVTLIGLNLGPLIAGTVIVEQIFSLPGMGQELFQAISNGDVPVVEAVVLVLSFAVVLANLGTDLLYSVLDPRVHYGSSKS
jgi:peptide/nickel transport system permease protein